MFYAYFACPEPGVEGVASYPPSLFCRQMKDSLMRTVLINEKMIMDYAGTFSGTVEHSKGTVESFRSHLKHALQSSGYYFVKFLR